MPGAFGYKKCCCVEVDTCCTLDGDRALEGPTFGFCPACGSPGYNDYLDLSQFGADMDFVGPAVTGTSDNGCTVTITSSGTAQLLVVGTSLSVDGCDNEYWLAAISSNGGTIGFFTIDITPPAGYKACVVLVGVANNAFGTISTLEVSETDNAGGESTAGLSVTTSSFTPCSLTQPLYGYSSRHGITQLIIDNNTAAGTMISGLHICLGPDTVPSGARLGEGGEARRFEDGTYRIME